MQGLWKACHFHEEAGCANSDLGSTANLFVARAERKLPLLALELLITSVQSWATVRSAALRLLPDAADRRIIICKNNKNIFTVYGLSPEQIIERRIFFWLGLDIYTYRNK